MQRRTAAAMLTPSSVSRSDLRVSSQLVEQLARALRRDVLLERDVRIRRGDRTLLADVQAADRHDRHARVSLRRVLTGRFDHGTRLLAPAAALPDADHERCLVLEVALAHLL